MYMGFIVYFKACNVSLHLLIIKESKERGDERTNIKYWFS